jgi:hypothetical protein
MSDNSEQPSDTCWNHYVSVLGVGWGALLVLYPQMGLMYEVQMTGGIMWDY